ncbi:MAG: dephospho-CoA kinase [Flavobacteriaceae bacterium]|jgi:dephospho-CoA kinase|nr:dephospho-CoA kinase [Flavobacteriaceae bacterium]|tara:strand:+ start:783 stop:1367 length:585 start_codon:yes stop_codon:yes gene_type:complete
MIKVAITGGIGTGKTTISNMFLDKGVPVFNSDEIAKEIMNTNSLLKNEIVTAFGDKVYDKNRLNKEYLSDAIFNNETLLKKINAIVHPYVADEFNSWIEEQDSKYIIYESAIIFENQVEDFFYKIICVTASEEDVISRVMKRNNFSVDKIKSIINKQLPNDAKIQKSDYVIENINISKLSDKVLEIHNDIMGSI